MLFESHMHELALGKLAEEHQSLSTDGMGTFDVGTVGACAD